MLLATWRSKSLSEIAAAVLSSNCYYLSLGAIAKAILV